MPVLADVDRVTGGGALRGPVTPVRHERERLASSCTTSRKWPAYPDLRRPPRLWARGCVWRGRGAARLHVAVDDFSRVAYAELLPGRAQGHLRGVFAGRCPRFFEGMGVRVERVMTDNGLAIAAESAQRAARIRAPAMFASRAYSPGRTGKVERMNRTPGPGMAVRQGVGIYEAGRVALLRLIERYNWERPHSACGGLPPMSRIVGVNNLSAHNS